jgi:hypothetical protein
MKNFIFLGLGFLISLNATADEGAQVNKRVRELSIQNHVDTEGKLLEESKEYGQSRAYVDFMATGIGGVGAIGMREWAKKDSFEVDFANAWRDFSKKLEKAGAGKSLDKKALAELQEGKKVFEKRLFYKNLAKKVFLIGPALAIIDSGRTLFENVDTSIILGHVAPKPSDLKRDQMFGPLDAHDVLKSN